MLAVEIAKDMDLSVVQRRVVDILKYIALEDLPDVEYHSSYDDAYAKSDENRSERNRKRACHVDLLEEDDGGVWGILED